MTNPGGAWVVQSVEYSALDFSSGRDLTVHGTEPNVGLCADTVETTWDSLSPSLSAPLAHTHALSLSLCLSQNK